MVKRKKVIVGLIGACLSIGTVMSQGIITANADPYHEMVPFNEIKLKDSYDILDDINDNKGNQWRVSEYEDGTLCITGLRNIKEHIEVPSQLNGKRVTGISGIPIYGRTQREEPTIKSIKIPSTVKRIHTSAFSGCINLEEIDLPKTTTRISKDSFAGTKWIENQKYENGFLVINNVLLDVKDAAGEIKIPSNVLAIGESVLSNNNDITSVYIPKNVIEVRQSAFANCANLEKAEFENNKTFVEPYGFSNCKKLTKGSFPIRNKIATYAFSESPVFDELVWEQSMVDGVSKAPEHSILDEIGSVEPADEGSYSTVKPNNSSLKKGWNIVGNNKVYVDSNNNLVTGWKTLDSKKYYFYGNGQMAVGFIDLGNDSLYYLNPVEGSSMGVLVTGWKYIDGNWYYFNSTAVSGKETGYMQTGWLYNNGSWYYFYGDGKMATGFINLGGDAYYYLEPGNGSSIGIMKTGWQKINGYWYYFNKSTDSGVTGMMRKGWQYIDGQWYYFYYGDGKMAASTYIDGYYVNASGAWV